MTLSIRQIAFLVVAWTAYGCVHSLLASLTVKRIVARRWPAAMRAYRLAFNGIAAALLVPPLWLTFAWGGPPLWEWSGAWAWLANGLALGAAAAFVWTTRHYDMSHFSGIAQWRGGQASPGFDGERLEISPLHRVVRHPWYFLGLVILWTRDMDAARLVSSLCVTAYLWLGSLLEERKLLLQYGEAYARYRAAVAGLVPVPWRILSRDEAQALATQGNGGNNPTGGTPFRNGTGGV